MLPATTNLGFISFLLMTVVTGAAPKLSQILPQTQIPEEAPIISKIFSQGKPDIFFNANTSLRSVDGNAIVIRNLGNRAFDAPRFTNFKYSAGGLRDGESHLVRITANATKAVFFNEVRSDLIGGVSTPTVVAIDPLGRVQPRVPLTSGREGKWIPVDLDADGIDEFLQESFDSNDVFNLQIYRRQADGSYGMTAIPFDSSVTIDRALAVDIEGDGDLDLAVFSGSGQESLTILESTGGLNYSPTPRFVGETLSDPTFSDLNGDGLADLHATVGSVFSYRINSGPTGFGIRLTAPVPNADVLAEVVPNANGPAAIRLSGFDGSVMKLISVRFGTWETLEENVIDISGLDPSFPAPQLVGFEDFDEDGIKDILIRSTSTFPIQTDFLKARRLSMAWGDGGGFLPATYIHPAPISTKITVTADLDGNIGKDIIIGPDLNGDFTLLGNTGEGTFPILRKIPEINPPSGSPENTGIVRIHAGDIDGDGVIDLAIDYENFVSGEGYRTACGIAKGNGDGTFRNPILPENSFGIITANPCGIDQLIDWDGDGDLDAVSAGRWRENLGGRFDGTFRTLIGGARVNDIFGNPINLTVTYAGDLDGDGFPDIVSFVSRLAETPETAPDDEPVITSLESFMAIAFNDGSGLTNETVEVPITLGGTDIFGNIVTGSAVFADMNSDNLPDLVTGEFGSYSIFGDITFGIYWRRNPGGGSRDPSSWVRLPFEDRGVVGGEKHDFDGDGILEWVSPNGFIRPDPKGPVTSPTYSLAAPVDLEGSNQFFTGDADGDDDVDFVYSHNDLTLVLLQNPIVDEDNVITRSLLAGGVKGAFAGPDKDADGDGRDNFTEYFFDTDPKSKDETSGDPFHLKVTKDGVTDSLSLVIPGGSWGKADIGFEYEMSNDLKTWRATQPASEGITIRLGNKVFRSVSFPPTSADSTFYRIRGFQNGRSPNSP